MKKLSALILTAFIICSLSACSGQDKSSSSTDSASTAPASSAAESAEQGGEASSQESTQPESAPSAEKLVTEFTPNDSGRLATASLFTERDLLQTPDLSKASTITAADNKTETITEEGTYIITGSASDFTVRVEANAEAKVQLVLDGLNVTNKSAPVIYVYSADKCFVTTNGNESSLSVTDAFTSDGDIKTDAVIFARDDLVLNGTGALAISSAKGCGISAKDELKITGGKYTVTSADDSIEVKDALSICGGSLELRSSKDGIQCKNSDDQSKGSVYITGADMTVTAENDAVQAATVCQIDGGKLSITGREGIESTYIQINDGEITINGSDDGINAGQKTNYSTPTVEINGGSLKITVGQGDTDAIDSNGDVIVNGGTIDITSTVSSFDYDGKATYTGGTIIINGEQVDTIPEPNMMGPGGMDPGGMPPGGQPPM